MTTAKDEDEVRLRWRIGLRTNWVVRPKERWGGHGAPRGAAWRCLDGGFMGFLLYLGDIADDDGSCGRYLPSQDKISDFCRCTRETVRLYYYAAEAAGLLRLYHSPKGQITGFQLLFPLGDQPRWEDANTVLRGDRRRRDMEHKRATQKDRRDAEVAARDTTEVAARDATSEESAESQVVSRDKAKWCHVTEQVAARDTTTRLTRQNTAPDGLGGDLTEGGVDETQKPDPSEGEAAEAEAARLRLLDQTPTPPNTREKVEHLRSLMPQRKHAS